MHLQRIVLPSGKEAAAVTASLYNQILFSIKGFYQFLDMRHASAVFVDADRPRGYAPDTY